MAKDIEDMDEKELEEARNSANNTENIRNAADVAIASGNAYAVAAGTAVKAADKVTGGKATEALGKGMTKVNKHSPMGKKVQNASNKLSESGASDKIGQAARMKNQYGGGAKSGATTAENAGQKAGQNLPDATNKVQENKVGGDQKGSLPSSSDKKQDGEKTTALEKKKKSTDKDSLDNDEGKSSKGIVGFLLKNVFISVLILFLPFILLMMVIIIIISSVIGIFTEYDDAFGMSQTLGEETGGVYYIASSEEQQAFYDRVNNVKLSFQAQGKSLDAMKIVALYHVLKNSGANIEYKDISESTISNWANSMFNDNMYDEETFKNNMINNIFPQYLSNHTQRQYEEYAEEVFNYIDRYNNLIGKNNNNSTCATMGSCTYEIKGFSFDGTNVSKNMTISNLKVRLMQCGSPYGNGSYTTPISDELIDFEKYAAGVAYAEVGDGAPIEQYKTQIVAARSFALSRPSSMGNSRGLKLEQENGQWILQISSCVADQVHCDIDKGCHGTGGSQGGYVVSGDDSSAWFHKPALPEDHDIRKAAAATQGEVLVNSQGYIINTGFLMTEQNLWRNLADQGLDYKQILMKTYGAGGVRSYGATDIQKSSCDGSGGTCSTGEWSTWRQGDPQWGSIEMGGSGETIAQIGCLVTSVSVQIARSGVETSINPFNPGTFVEFLNKNGGFARGGNFVWASPQKAAPRFVYGGAVSVSGMSQSQKLNAIKELVSQQGVYVVAEVKGNTGQHWVAVIGVNGSTVEMVDPASDSTDMWSQYNWANTSTLEYYKVS